MKGDYAQVNGAVTLILDLRITSYGPSRQCFLKQGCHIGFFKAKFHDFGFFQLFMHGLENSSLAFFLNLSYFWLF